MLCVAFGNISFCVLEIINDKRYCRKIGLHLYQLITKNSLMETLCCDSLELVRRGPIIFYGNTGFFPYLDKTLYFVLF